MRLFLAMLFAGALAGCCSCPTPPPAPAPTVVIPQGSTVVCPNGSPATLSEGTYRC